jgi:GntR family transcriptional regulator, transcriptional repressor for pyruvate dehydrogenase complex
VTGVAAIFVATGFPFYGTIGRTRKGAIVTIPSRRTKSGLNPQTAARRGRKPKKDRSAEIAEGLFGTNRPGGLHERVYHSLVHAITSGRFEKGVRLPSEPELAAAFAVSRPVVRQALDRLKNDGLIESQRGSGNYVAAVDDLIKARLPSGSDQLLQTRRMMDDLEFRLVIEPEAAFFAARRRSPTDIERMESALRKFEEAHATGAITHHFDYLFHEAIALATTNEHFVEAVRSLEYRPDDERIPMRHLVHFQPRDRGIAVLREHAEVFDLIHKREPEAARRAMWSHIDAARLRLMKHGSIPVADKPLDPSGGRALQAVE